MGLFLYSPASGSRLSPSPEALKDALEGRGAFWLDLGIADLPQLAPLQGLLPGHPLNWEDAGKPNQRPKIDERGDHLFLVFRGLDDARPRLAEQLQTHQLAVFLGSNYLLTIHSGPIRSIELAQARLDREPELFQKGPDALLHAILDDLIDRFAPHVEAWENEMDRLLTSALERPRQSVMGRILAVRKHLVKLRRLALGQREILGQLLRQHQGHIQTSQLPYFQDVHDHLTTLVDASETLRDSVSIAVDVYLNSVNNRLNEIMKILTVMSAIMLPLTLISGIYGMNFLKMPGLAHPYGFFWVLGGMALIAISMLIYFRRSRWL